MELKSGFVFQGLPAVATPTDSNAVNLNELHAPVVVGPDIKPFPFPFPFHPLNPLGPLASLLGEWEGTGFNMIWRPIFNQPPPQDRFLELNLTKETLQFEQIPGDIPNRGMVQADINMHGMTYMQQITDANLGVGLHVEPGIWATVPSTTNPLEQATVVRMASIPHGTTILAQGLATAIPTGPTIPHADIRPFPIGNPDPAARILFNEQTLTNATTFRSPPNQIVGITQGMLDDPNSVLRSALAGQTVLSTIQLDVSTVPTGQLVGGGTANTAFLQGTGSNQNAQSAAASATFWIETIKGENGAANFLQLQYTQLVLLNFRTLSWPHVTVGTLRKKVSAVAQLPPIALEAGKPIQPGDPGPDLAKPAVKPVV